MRQYTILAIFFLILFSCQKLQIKKMEAVVSEMQGKKIYFPTTLMGTVMEKDTTCTWVFDKQNRLVVYFDSTGCTPCKMKVSDWKMIIQSAKDSLPNLSFVFVISPKIGEARFVRKNLQMNKMDYPFFIDSLNQFGKINSIPTDNRFHTFLIDRQNRIVLVGSPIGNEKMWKLYKDYIKKRIKNTDAPSEVEHEYMPNRKETQIEIHKDSENLGRFSFQSIKYVSFQLKNNGKQPLIIQSVNTSCGCTAAKYDKKPIPSGKTTTVELEYKPNSLGFFTKTADVVCNVPKGYVRLKISGEVVEK